MRNLAIPILLAAATTAFAQDEDPDLAVLSGKIAAEAPGNVNLTLRRLVADERGDWAPAKFTRKATVSAGQEFRFAGLPPCPYELTIEADGCDTETRRVDVFADVANVEVRPAPTSPQQLATVAGKLTLGFGGALADCKVRLLSGAIDERCDVLPDGSFTAAGLRAGPAWAIVDGTRTIDVPVDGAPPQRKSVGYRRIVPLTLAPGANPVELRVDSEEEVAAVIRSSTAGETVDGRAVDLDPTPFDPWTRTFRFVWPADGKPVCWRWTTTFGITQFGPAGAELPLFAWAKGAHKLRVEAAGFEPLEQEVAVAGATRLELTMKPLPGDYARPSIEGAAWWIEEPGADGEWKPIASWDGRIRSSHTGRPPMPAVFLAPGEHLLRGVRVGSAPSAPLKVQAGEGRVERGVAFVFPTGWTLRGSLRTKSGGSLTGFRAYCFLRQDEKLERERGHDFVADLDFTVTGLTKGRHVFAFDEKGEHPFAEFDMGEKDVAREFDYKAR
jgi:hypothetical protein